MNFSGLSLDQAPPISAPLRFFFTAPLFGFLGALFIFFSDSALFESRFSLESIALTHIFTIGMMAFVMLGALQQMLPVLASVTLPNALNVARSSHILLLTGLLSMIYGLLAGQKIVLFMASALLLLGFLIIIIAIIVALSRTSYLSATIIAMMFSVGVLLFVVLIGGHLLASHASENLSALHLSLANIHALLGIFGFGVMLIVGVSFQVLPMFYVTPDFSKFLNRRLSAILLLLITLFVILVFINPDLTIVIKSLMALSLSIYAFETLYRIKERKRPVKDVTLLFWQSGAYALVLGLLFWIVDDFSELDLSRFSALFIGGGFILGVIHGMLYKIVPFLIWFHLNGSGYMSIPSITEMIDQKYARVNYYLYFSALLLFLFSFYLSFLVKIAALLLASSMILLQYNLYKSVKIYINTKKTEPDFDMSMMS